MNNLYDLFTGEKIEQEQELPINMIFKQFHEEVAMEDRSQSDIGQTMLVAIYQLLEALAEMEANSGEDNV